MYTNFTQSLFFFAKKSTFIYLEEQKNTKSKIRKKTNNFSLSSGTPADKLYPHMSAPVCVREKKKSVHHIVF